MFQKFDYNNLHFMPFEHRQYVTTVIIKDSCKIFTNKKKGFILHYVTLQLPYNLTYKKKKINLIFDFFTFSGGTARNRANF